MSREKCESQTFSHLDAVDVKSVFPVLCWQHNKDWLGARPSQINEFHRKMAGIAFYSRGSCVTFWIIRKFEMKNMNNSNSSGGWKHPIIIKRICILNAGRVSKQAEDGSDITFLSSCAWKS